MSRKPTPILIPMKEVCALTSLSRTMINRLRVAGRFPDAVELGEHRVAFVRSEVLAWIEERIAGRTSQAPDGKLCGREGQFNALQGMPL
ncbi:AlpA family transcriptional regulator [Ensifer sp. YR511]|uniref:helix-turn-helix transcriptional regulator n=1 Tax=Ensifer sp. YR511 TaxID=1855294 RepID=UPI00087F1A66|nr:AlpA family phage regulatory protein [Ensifer sp. YR511]SDN84123.1 transcriptional regulator, AlpA family [Ensifer sp. YR511]